MSSSEQYSYCDTLTVFDKSRKTLCSCTKNHLNDSELFNLPEQLNGLFANPTESRSLHADLMVYLEIRGL